MQSHVASREHRWYRQISNDVTWDGREPARFGQLERGSWGYHATRLRREDVVRKRRSTCPCERPWRPIWLWDVEAPTCPKKWAHRLRWGSQPYAPAVLYPQEDSWYSFLLEAEWSLQACTIVPQPWSVWSRDRTCSYELQVSNNFDYQPRPLSSHLTSDNR
jgi:hypothetical protein